MSGSMLLNGICNYKYMIMLPFRGCVFDVEGALFRVAKGTLMLGLQIPHVGEAMLLKGAGEGATRSRNLESGWWT